MREVKYRKIVIYSYQFWTMFDPCMMPKGEDLPIYQLPEDLPHQSIPFAQESYSIHLYIIFGKFNTSINWLKKCTKTQSPTIYVSNKTQVQKTNLEKSFASKRGLKRRLHLALPNHAKRREPLQCSMESEHYNKNSNVMI